MESESTRSFITKMFSWKLTYATLPSRLAFYPCAVNGPALPSCPWGGQNRSYPLLVMWWAGDVTQGLNPLSYCVKLGVDAIWWSVDSWLTYYLFFVSLVLRGANDTTSEYLFTISNVFINFQAGMCTNTMPSNEWIVWPLGLRYVYEDYT